MEDRDVDMRTLGAAIARRRRGKGFTGRKLAERIGISPSYLSDIEHGNGVRPGVGILARIAYGLRISLDDLVRDAGLPSAPATIAELEALYADLDSTMRNALRRNAETLRDIQAEYARMQDDEGDVPATRGEDEELGDTTLPSPTEPLAAPGGSDTERLRRGGKRREPEESR